LAKAGLHSFLNEYHSQIAAGRFWRPDPFVLVTPLNAPLPPDGLLAAVLLASCGSDASGPAPSSDAALHVVTTFLPITEFTKAVAGTCATVEAPDANHGQPPRFPGHPR